MRINFKKYIVRLLILSFSAAAISDIIYGRVEVAGEYLIGNFIGQIFGVSMAFAFMLCLLGFIYNVFIKEMFDHRCLNCACEAEVRKFKKGHMSKGNYKKEDLKMSKEAIKRRNLNQKRGKE